MSQEVSAADQSEAEHDPEMALERFKESPLPEEIQRLILEYRKEDPGAGFKRIELVCRFRFYMIFFSALSAPSSVKTLRLTPYAFNPAPYAFCL